MGFLIEESFGFLKLKRRWVYVDRETISVIGDNLDDLRPCLDPSPRIWSLHILMKKYFSILDDWVNKDSSFSE